MDNTKENDIRAHREMMKTHIVQGPHYESDMQMKVPAPLIAKPAAGGLQIELTKEFDGILKKRDILSILEDRISHRKYKDEPVTLEELSFLLFMTQGVRRVDPKNKYTMRTVPSAGARNPYETYLFVNDVRGLEPGVYHYLALEHKLEFLYVLEDQKQQLTKAYAGQSFFGEAPVCFVWSVIPYRTEWRYVTKAHKYMLIDAGHICENLYLACEAIGCGTCGIGAYDQVMADELLRLDSAPLAQEDCEFVVYAACVGKV